MKKILNILIVLVLLIPSLFLPEKVYGKTINQIEKEIRDYKNQISNNQNAQKLSEKEIQTINSNIALLDAEIKMGEIDIVNLINEIDKMNKEIEEKRKEMEKILNFFQLSNGEDSYLEYTFGAADFTDFIYRSAVTEQLTNYNKKLIKEFNEKIEYNKKRTEEIKIKEKENLEKQNKLQADMAKLRNQIKDLSKEIGNAEDGIKEYDKMLQELKALGCGANEEAQACYARHNQLPSDTKFWRPTMSGYVTSEFGYRTLWGRPDFHYGLDTGHTIGTPVYAIAAGKVFSHNYWPGTGYVVYIHHLVNGQRYTSVYEHLSRYNSYVGQIVTKDSIIAYSGNTGESSGPHLHLSILTGWAGVDYYLWSGEYFARNINPRTKINYPRSYSSWSDRLTWHK